MVTPFTLGLIGRKKHAQVRIIFVNERFVFLSSLGRALSVDKVGGTIFDPWEFRPDMSLIHTKNEVFLIIVR